MRVSRFVIAMAAMLMALAVFSPTWALAQAEGPSEVSLSPYWAPAVLRWEELIVRYSQLRGLDPDLVAAVIWKESLGRPKAHSPAGAVGLMMLMPFPWRPSARELENPWTNVAWGTRTLAQIIRDGRGDLYYALAAYNGSWEKADQVNTRRYAAAVLDSYARAVAVEQGLPEDGDWIAIFALEELPGAGTITVLGPQRPLARYTARPWCAEIPSVPAGVPPITTAAVFVDEQGVASRVGMWLVAADGSPLFGAPAAAPPGTELEPGITTALGRLQASLYHP